jgi:hypothetical protein
MQQSGINMFKGLWWTETLSNRFSPRYNFSYVASFNGNKVIVNNHHINPTSYGNYKFWSQAHMVDLVTMEKSAVPYGCLLAQDYVINCTSKGNDDYFEWSSLEVMDKKLKVLHKIERKNKVPPPENDGWGYIKHFELIKVFVNEKPGENTIILVNYHLSVREKAAEEVKMTVEVYDLKSGKLISERKVDAKEVIGYCGNDIVVVHNDRVSLLDLNSKNEMTLSSDANRACYYISDGEIAIREKSKVKIFSFSARKEIHEIDLGPILKQISPYGPIRALAFDKTKLVVTYELNSSAVHFVVNAATGKLITTLFSPGDRISSYAEPKIHLAPNGKIVTDAFNLTVYDFVHPYANPELSIPVAFLSADKIQQTTIKASELGKYATEKLNTPFEKLKIRTLYQSHAAGRVTLIYPNSDNEWGSDGVGHNAIFLGYEPDEQKRSAWQLTLNDVKQVAQCEFLENINSYHESDFGYERAKQAVLVYEKFNSKKHQWEFCAPCVDADRVELVKS